MSESKNQDTKGQGGIIRAALFAWCPRCTARNLWDAPAAFAPRCRACGLAFEDYEPKGRGLYLVLFPVTLLLMAGALRVDDTLHPPLWLLFPALVVIVPLTMIAALRLAKAAVLIMRLRAAGVLR
ncbi:MAG: DUF983 domain-containing protein [Novosphingobium sp.]